MRSCVQILLLTFLTVGAEADIRVSSGCYVRNREMEHIDKYGHAVKVYCLGTFKLADRDVPLYAYWTSAAHSSKTLLGHGWHIPWLECRMFPIDGARYQLDSPFGDHLIFTEEKKSKLYRFGRGACATVTKGVVNVYCQAEPTSVPDMTFFEGRLVQFRYASKVFKVIYEKGRFRRIALGERTVLAAERMPFGKSGIAVYFNGRRDSPVPVITGLKTVCVGYDSGKQVLDKRETVVGFRTASGESFGFSYGVGGTKCWMNDGVAEVVWNPETRKIISHGDWTYDLTGHDPDHGIYRLRRTNLAGEKEEYSYDLKSGIRIRVRRHVRDVARLFTSGKLRGMIRWSEQRLPGCDKIRKEYSYDENKHLVYCRYINKTKSFYYEYWYDQKGRVDRSRKNGDNATLLRFKYLTDGLRMIEREGTVGKAQEKSAK